MKGFCGFHSWRLPSITFFLYCHDLVRVLRHESRFCLYPIHNACLQQVIWRKNPLLLHVGDIPKVACASRAARAIKFKVGCIVVVVNWRVARPNNIYWQFSWIHGPIYFAPPCLHSTYLSDLTVFSNNFERYCFPRIRIFVLL